MKNFSSGEFPPRSEILSEGQAATIHRPLARSFNWIPLSWYGQAANLTRILHIRYERRNTSFLGTIIAEKQKGSCNPEADRVLYLGLTCNYKKPSILMIILPSPVFGRIILNSILPIIKINFNPPTKIHPTRIRYHPTQKI